MKQIINIIAALLFSVLFYNQAIGLNLLVFSILTNVFLLICNPNLFKNKKTITFGFIYLATAVFVFINNSLIAILANIAAFITLIGSLKESKPSIYVHWLNGLFTAVAGIFQRTFDAQNTSKEEQVPNRDIDALHIVKLIAIPSILVIIFVLLYRNGNPVFQELIDGIDFSYLEFQWILFAVLGYFLFNNISKPVIVESATELDLKTNNALAEIFPFKVDVLQKENQLATLLFSLLNLVLLLYISTDFIALSKIDYSRASVLSDQVHNGINTLIASILIAIVIILYFFRGNLNFYKKNKTLKILVYLWIALNIILIGLIAFKNQNYISSFGLTYKRIGVHIYILMTLIGLITTVFKLLKVRNLLFLIRINTLVAFAILMLSSTINWDASITTYNITSAKNFDVDYLINLSNNNATILFKLKDKTTLSENDKNRIDYKYKNYLKKIERQNWQELHFEAMKLKNN